MESPLKIQKYNDSPFINIKMAEPIEPKFLVRPRVNQGKCFNDRIFKNLPLTKFDF